MTWGIRLVICRQARFQNETGCSKQAALLFGIGKKRFSAVLFTVQVDSMFPHWFIPASYCSKREGEKQWPASPLVFIRA